ncbi:MAG: cytidine deaminase [Clostridia bacterium]|nr:cytidine deaminase [Clostridia bacterium]
MEQEILQKLIDKAREAGERAYCPYTETPVGACVLTQNGMIFTGCNIENIALSGSFGAMEVAICKAISEGGNNIMAVAVYCDKGLVFPSGSERQLLREFGSRTTIVCATKNKQEQFTIQELLPFAKENICEN